VSVSLPLLVDWDGVISQFVPAFISVYNEYADQDARSRVRADEWGFDQVLKDKQAVKRAWNDARIFSEQDPYPGAIEALRELNDRYEVLIVTACTDKHALVVPAKFRWYRKHMPFMKPEQFIYARNKQWIRGQCLIDDYHENVLGWMQINKKPAILIQRSWNKNELELVKEAGGLVSTTGLPGALVLLKEGLK
jgi:5'(3')-deoxyribonucleotidase